MPSTITALRLGPPAARVLPALGIAREPRHVALARFCDVLPVGVLEIARQVRCGETHRIEAQRMRPRPDHRSQIRFATGYLLHYRRHDHHMGERGRADIWSAWDQLEFVELGGRAGGAGLAGRAGVRLHSERRGGMLVPVPRREDLAGLARGASPRDYRDRTDRA